MHPMATRRTSKHEMTPPSYSILDGTWKEVNSKYKYHGPKDTLSSLPSPNFHWGLLALSPNIICDRSLPNGRQYIRHKRVRLEATVRVQVKAQAAAKVQMQVRFHVDTMVIGIPRKGVNYCAVPNALLSF